MVSLHRWVRRVVLNSQNRLKRKVSNGNVNKFSFFKFFFFEAENKLGTNISFTSDFFVSSLVWLFLSTHFVFSMYFDILEQVVVVRLFSLILWHKQIFWLHFIWASANIILNSFQKLIANIDFAICKNLCVPLHIVWAMKV